MKVTLSKLFFLIGTVGLVAVHTMQLLFMTETATGFFKPQYEYLRVYLGIFAVAVAVLMFFFGFVKNGAENQRIKIGKPLAIFSIVCSVAFLTGAFLSSVSSLGTLSLIKLLTALFTAIFLLMFGLSGLFGISVSKIFTVLSLPYFIFSLVECFIRDSGMSLISENSYEILMLCATLMFFLYAAKFICGIDREKNLRVLVPFGYIASMLCLTCTVSRYIIILLGKRSVLKVNAYPDFSIFLIGIFIAVFCFSVLKKERKNVFVPQSPAKETNAADDTLKIPETEELSNNDFFLHDDEE